MKPTQSKAIDTTMYHSSYYLSTADIVQTIQDTRHCSRAIHMTQQSRAAKSGKPMYNHTANDELTTLASSNTGTLVPAVDMEGYSVWTVISIIF